MESAKSSGKCRVKRTSSFLSAMKEITLDLGKQSFNVGMACVWTWDSNAIASDSNIKLQKIIEFCRKMYPPTDTLATVNSMVWLHYTHAMPGELWLVGDMDMPTILFLIKDVHG